MSAIVKAYPVWGYIYKQMTTKPTDSYNMSKIERQNPFYKTVPR